MPFYFNGYGILFILPLGTSMDMGYCVQYYFFTFRDIVYMYLGKIMVYNKVHTCGKIVICDLRS